MLQAVSSSKMHTDSTHGVRIFALTLCGKTGIVSDTSLGEKPPISFYAGVCSCDSAILFLLSTILPRPTLAASRSLLGREVRGSGEFGLRFKALDPLA